MKISFSEISCFLPVTLNQSQNSFFTEFESFIGGGGEPYSGAYEVIPMNATQILPTMGKTLSDNITVKPIPSNYGLITYNGFELTVS